MWELNSVQKRALHSLEALNDGTDDESDVPDGMSDSSDDVRIDEDDRKLMETPPCASSFIALEFPRTDWGLCVDDGHRTFERHVVALVAAVAALTGLPSSCA